MAFVELRPSTIRTFGGYTGDKVRVSFPIISDNQCMILYFGKDVAKKYGLSKGDRVILAYDESNPCVWRIIKDDNGWKLSDSGKCLKLHVTWLLPIPARCGKMSKFVTVKHIEGFMNLYLPGAMEEELNHNEV